MSFVIFQCAKRWLHGKKRQVVKHTHTIISSACFFFVVFGFVLLLAGLRKIAKNWEVPVKGMVIVTVYLQIQCTIVSGVPRIYGLTHCCGQIIECLVV